MNLRPVRSIQQRVTDPAEDGPHGSLEQQGRKIPVETILMTRVRQGTVPTPKLSQRGRRIFLLIAGGILVSTLVLHFWYFPQLSKHQPSQEQTLSTQGIGKENKRLKDP